MSRDRRPLPESGAIGRRVSLRTRKEHVPSRVNEGTELGRATFLLCLLHKNPTPAEPGLQFRAAANFSGVAFSATRSRSRIISVAGRALMIIELAPSILSANFARLADDAKAALEGGGTVLHLDVMDGHFVPNITIGPPVVASLRKALPDATFDCHLMIENPDNYIPAFAEAGANWISVHPEACVHLHRTLQLIESHGCQPAVVINPATPVHTLDEVLDMVHHVLVLSVNPGFGAQTFIHASLNKIKTLAEVRESLGLSFRIEVDGGVAPVTA